MPLAVTLRLSDPAAAEVECLWHALAEQTGERCVIELGYRPHVTLAVLSDDLLAKSLEDAALRVISGWKVLPIELTGVEMFPGPLSTVWASPALSEGLIACHSELIATLSGFQIHPHYRAGSWVPHVTLGRPSAATAPRCLQIAASLWKGPIAGQLDQADLVHFSPVSLLRSVSLSAADDT